MSCIVARAILFVAVAVAAFCGAVYLDVYQSQPFFAVKTWTFQFAGEGADAFRARLSGDAQDFGRRSRSTLIAQHATCRTQLEVASAAGTKILPLGVITATSPASPDHLIKFGGTSPTVRILLASRFWHTAGCLLRLSLL